MPTMSTEASDEGECKKHAALDVCREVTNRAPLLLPLAVVTGIIYGGAVGWSVVCVALLAACVLRAWRVLLCAVLCGVIVALCAALRQRTAERLQLTAQPPPSAVQVRGTVVRTLNRSCFVEIGMLGVRVAVYGEIPVQVGDRVRVVGELLPAQEPLVPGMFSPEEWMRGQGISARLACLRAEREGRSSFGYAALLRVAESMRSALADRLMPPGTEEDVRRQVLCALVLGEKERADDSTIDIFRRGGCLHAFAVSGLHVGIVASILWALLRLCRVHPAAGRWVQLIGVGLYVFATGMAAPALRAYVMLAALLGALMLRRRVSFLNTWCFAALIILMLRPYQLHQPGFQLSFLVYGAICLGVRYGMSDSPWFGPDPYIPVRIHTSWERRAVSAELLVRGAVVVSLCAWLTSLPLSIVHFHVVNTASYLINILIAPLLPVVMLTGLLLLATSGVPLLGGVAQAGALGSAGWLVSLVGVFGSVPGAYLPAAPPAGAGDYMLLPLSNGKCACVLGNPGILTGDARGENVARHIVQPALFHAGYSPVLCPKLKDDAAMRIYSQSWPQLRYFTAPPGSAPQRFTTPAGVFTIFAPPAGLPTRYSANASPVIHWQRQDKRCLLFVGDAALSTFEAIPEDFQRADILILGYNSHEPITDPELLHTVGMERIILLPRARGHGVETSFPRETAENGSPQN